MRRINESSASLLDPAPFRDQRRVPSMLTSEVVYLSRFQTVMGQVVLASTERGLVVSSLPGRSHASKVAPWIKAHLPGHDLVKDDRRNRAAVEAIQTYLEGGRRNLDVRLDLRGTPFQLAVWHCLREVPYGTTISYSELAQKAGHGRAVRACGSANRVNPLPLFVPCHRVLAKNGTLGGFGGGLPLKRRLLDLEQRVCRGET